MSSTAVSRFAALAAATLALSSPAFAVEPQYRRVTLADGRELTSEIVATLPSGLQMRVPQGLTVVSFELLVDMVPIDKAEYDAQPPWVVFYDVPPELESDVADLLNAMHIQPQSIRVSGNGVTAAMGSKAQQCGHNIGCIADEIRESPWKWVLTITPATTGGLAMSAKVNLDSRPVEPLILDGPSRNELWKKLHEAIGLEQPTGTAPRSATAANTIETAPPPSAALDEGKILALSFVPVPGLPSLAQNDLGGFALSSAVILPSAALWFVVSGQSSPTTAPGARSGATAEWAALFIGGVYAVTVVTNQVTGLKSLEKHRLAVGAAPTDRGAQLVVSTSATGR